LRSFSRQSAAWGAILKILPRWYNPEEYPKIIGWFSLSYGVGDAIIRAILGTILAAEGAQWPTVLYVGVVVSAVIAIPSWFVMRSSPTEIGEKEPDEADTVVYRKLSEDKRIRHPSTNPILIVTDQADEKQQSVWQLMRPILLSARFWVVIFMYAPQGAIVMTTGTLV
jgi:sugar phosphate permease